MTPQNFVKWANAQQEDRAVIGGLICTPWAYVTDGDAERVEFFGDTLWESEDGGEFVAEDVLDEASEIALNAAAWVRLLPLAEWHEDYGNALWFRVPIEEPGWCGTPLDVEWEPDYWTHWMPLPNIRGDEVP